MPQKNSLKEYVAESYYHVYARGVNKQKIFQEAGDYYYFLSLLDRYLSGKRAVSNTGTVYPDYSQEINLLSYCLMSNHFHMLIYQQTKPESLRKFMSSLMTSYSKYFNYKYRRVGAVFESRYKAKRIEDDSYLMHISRYIHMNPRRWLGYRHSSLRYLFSKEKPEWLTTDSIENAFKSKQEYINFLDDYQENKNILEEIKYQLANV